MMSSATKGCDVIIHLAALIAIPYSYQAPQSYVETNVMGTLNMLQAANRNDIQHFIHTSTSEVYGSAQHVPMVESHPLVGQSPYSATKIAADQLAYSFFASHQTPITIIRPFNTYGPRQSVRAVIPTIITQLARGADEIKLGNIQATETLISLMTQSLGFRRLSTKRSIGEVINIGSNFEISIAEVVGIIAKEFNRNVTVLCDSKRLRPDKAKSIDSGLIIKKQKRSSTGAHPFRQVRL